MILETERFILRPWEKEDAAAVYELAKDPNVGPPCGWTPHKSLQESKAVLRDILMNDYTFAIVAKDTKQVIGNISIMPYSESRFARSDNQAEIGFWLGYPYWGQGYMTEACKKMIEYGFNELKLDIIWCGHESGNMGSMRVQQKAGFEFDHEDSYYAKELDERVCVKVNCIKNDFIKFI